MFPGDAFGERKKILMHTCKRFSIYVPSDSLSHTHNHTNKAESRQGSVHSPCVHMYVSAVCLGFWEAQLPQLSTLALASKSDGHHLPGCSWTPCSSAQCSPEPRTLQMIYYIDWQREFSPFISDQALSTQFFISVRPQGMHSPSHSFFFLISS